MEDLVALAEHSSFSSAAKKRNISQSAFSRRIKTIENWLGIEIADRSRHPVRIHPAVSDNLDNIRRLLYQAADLRSRIRSHYHNTDRLVIVTQHCLALSHLPRLIRYGESSRVRPGPGPVSGNLHRVRTLNRQDAISQFIVDQVDVLLTVAMPDESLDLLAQFPQKIIDTDALVAVVQARLKSRLNRLPVLGYPEESYFYTVLQQNLESEIFSLVQEKTVYESAVTENLLHMCQLGNGITFLPAGMVQDALKARQLADVSRIMGKAPLNVHLFTKTPELLCLLSEIWDCTQ